MFDILMRNLFSERHGNWEEYLCSLEQMLPGLAATGRRNYTKSVYWFLQEMDNLDDYTLSVFKQGGFVVRRTGRPDGGISPDLAIEQVLMASLKGNTGLTRGRGFTELNYLIWIMSRPVVCAIDKKIKEMTKVELKTSEQSSVKEVKQERPSRIKNYEEHVGLIEKFFTERLLFDPAIPNKDSVINIASGLVSPPEVNVNEAREVGMKIIKSMVGQNPLELKMLKTSLAIQIPSKQSMKMAGVDSATAKLAQIDPQLLFQRALNFANDESTETSLEEVLKHELFPVSLPLFDDNGFMRSPVKADLATYLIADENKEYNGLLKENENNVFDGGALLHRVGWDKQARFSDICLSYSRHITNLIGPSKRATIVFDGYLDHSTKDHCHKKRCPVSALTIAISEDTKLSCKKNAFLSNKGNKQTFVDMLGQHLQCSGHNVVMCEGDADVRIVQEAMNILTQRSGDTIIVGDDTDVLVLAIHHFRLNMNNSSHDLWMFRPSSSTIINIRNVILKLPERILEELLFIHAASGCDTTSSLVGIGKTKLAKLLAKQDDVVECSIFYEAEPDPEVLFTVGTYVMALLYDSKNHHESLEDLRVW